MPKRKAAATWAAGTASAPSAPPPSDHASAAFGLAAPPPSPGQPQAAPLPQLTELQAAPPQPQLPQAPLPQAPLPGGLLLGPAQARAAPPQPQLPQALLPQVLPTASLGWQQLPAQPAGLLAHLPGVPLVSAPAPAPGLPTLMSRAESSAVSRLVEQIEQIEPKLSAATQSQLDAIAQQVVAALVAAGGRQLHAPGLRVQQKQYLGHLADQLQMARRDLLQAGRRLTLVQARDLVYAYLLRQLEQERRHLPDDQRLTLQQFFQQAQQAQTAQQAQQTQQERRLTDEQRLTLQQFFQQAQQAHQAQQAQQAQQAATAQALLEQLQLAAALQALFKHRTPVPLLSSSRQTTCPPCTLDGFVSEFGSASAAGPAAMADYVLSHLELAAPFIPVARAVLTFAFSQPGGLVRVGLYRRDTEADSWPFAKEVIALLSGPGGAAVALPEGYVLVRGTERVVIMFDLYRWLLTGSLPESGFGPVRRPGDSLDQPSRGTRRLFPSQVAGTVYWVMQQCGDAWGRVCLPLFAMAAAVGSCPVHPRSKGKFVPFSISLLGCLKAVCRKEE